MKSFFIEKKLKLKLYFFLFIPLSILFIPIEYKYSIDTIYQIEMHLLQKDSVFFSGIGPRVTFHTENKWNHLSFHFPVYFYQEDQSYETGAYGISFHEFEKEENSDLFNIFHNPLNTTLWIDSFGYQHKKLTLEYRNKYFESRPLSQIMWNHPLYRQSMPGLSRIVTFKTPWFNMYSNSLYESNKFIFEKNIQSNSVKGIFHKPENSIYLWYFNNKQVFGFGNDFKSEGYQLNNIFMGVFSGIEGQYINEESTYTNKNSIGLRFGLWNFETRTGYLLQTKNHPGSPALSPISISEFHETDNATGYAHGFTIQSLWIYDLPFITDIIDIIINQIQFSPVEKKKMEIILDTIKEENLFLSSIRMQIAHYGRHFQWQTGYMQNKIASIDDVFTDRYNNFIFFQIEKPVIERFIFLNLETYYQIYSEKTALSSSFSVRMVF